MRGLAGLQHDLPGRSLGFLVSLRTVLYQLAGLPRLGVDDGRDGHGEVADPFGGLVGESQMTRARAIWVQGERA